MSQDQSNPQWLSGLRTYVVASFAGHATWETLQVPLYQLFWSGTPSEIAFAVLHCIGGDLLIAGSTLLAALMLFGHASWPKPSARTRRVALAAVTIGLAYTVFSEWWNTAVRASWSYTDAMPVLPPFGTGLAPFMQWLFVPTLALWHTGRRYGPKMEHYLQAGGDAASKS